MLALRLGKPARPLIRDPEVVVRFGVGGIQLQRLPEMRDRVVDVAAGRERPRAEVGVRHPARGIAAQSLAIERVGVHVHPALPPGERPEHREQHEGDRDGPRTRRPARQTGGDTAATPARIGMVARY